MPVLLVLMALRQQEISLACLVYTWAAERRKEILIVVLATKIRGS